MAANITAKDMCKALINDEIDVADLTSDQLNELKEAINPYFSILCEDSWAALSIVNHNEDRFKRICVTALIGFLFGLASEYEKEVDPESKGHVIAFLKHNFQYDPSRHIRTAHTDPQADPNRKSKLEAIAELKSKAMQPPTNPTLEAQGAYQILKRTHTIITDAIKLLPSNSIEKLKMSTEKVNLEMEITKFEKHVAPTLARNAIVQYQHDPPADLFYNLNRYMDNNYEGILQVTNDVYNEKTDIGYSVCYYDSFKNEQAASDFIKINSDNFKIPAYVIKNNSITVMGAYQQNMEKVAFYNSNTAILEKLMNQAELDAKLGKDLMEKRKVSKKKKNIKETGPDGLGLSAYVKDSGVITNLGSARDPISLEEQRKIFEADTDMPPDSVRVDVHTVKVDEEGNSSLTSSKFYSQAEAPLHLEDPKYGDKYQPKKQS